MPAPVPLVCRACGATANVPLDQITRIGRCGACRSWDVDLNTCPDGDGSVREAMAAEIRQHNPGISAERLEGLVDRAARLALRRVAYMESVDHYIDLGAYQRPVTIRVGDFVHARGRADVGGSHGASAAEVLEIAAGVGPDGGGIMLRVQEGGDPFWVQLSDVIGHLPRDEASVLGSA